MNVCVGGGGGQDDKGTTERQKVRLSLTLQV